MAVDKNLRPAPPEFAQRIARLIDAYHPRLVGARFDVQVRDQAVKHETAHTWGEVDTADNPGEERKFDFTMWFALDAWAVLDEMQRDALADHELCHCGWDAAGKPLLISHDIEEFNAVIARYGLWWPGAQATRVALLQAPAQPSAERGIEMAHVQEGGGHGSTGAYQHPMQGGGHGSTGAYQAALQGGGHGSTGAFGTTVYTDPGLLEGGDYHTVPIGDGKTIQLCPACYAALVQSILADLAGATG